MNLNKKEKILVVMRGVIIGIGLTQVAVQLLFQLIPYELNIIICLAYLIAFLVVLVWTYWPFGNPSH